MTLDRAVSFLKKITRLAALPGVLGAPRGYVKPVAAFEREIDLDPESVWNVLEDPASYPQWVAGGIEVVDADPRVAGRRRGVPLRLSLGAVQALGASNRSQIAPLGPSGDPVVTRPHVGFDRARSRWVASSRGCILQIVEDPAGLRGAALSGISWLAGPSANARSLERLAGLAQRRGRV